VFTGIVEELGRVVAVEHGAQSARLTVEGPVVAADAAHGTSIAVDGVCLTVVDHEGERSRVDVVQRLLRATAEVAA
jgi:riboflavin synthase